MRETALKSKVADELRKKHGCFVVALAGSQHQQPGLPDLLIIKDGLHIYVECKGPETITRNIQSRMKVLLQQHGCNVFQLRFFEEKEWLIDNQFSIKFSKFAEGVKLLLDSLTKMIQPKSEHTYLETMR